jgi:hypothetical protein
MSNSNTYHALPVLGGPGSAAATRGPGVRGQAPPPPPPAPRLFPAGRTNSARWALPAQPLPAPPPPNPIGNNNNNNNSNNGRSTGTLEATEFMPNQTQFTNNTGLNPYVGETNRNVPPSNAITGGRRKRRMSRKRRVSRKRKVSRRKSKKTSRK